MEKMSKTKRRRLSFSDGRRLSFSDADDPKILQGEFGVEGKFLLNNLDKFQKLWMEHQIRLRSTPAAQKEERDYKIRILMSMRMAERQLSDQQPPADAQLQSPLPGEDMISCVMALEAALLPCLPARELQAIDRSPHPSHQIDVERHARDFMEAAKKLQLYFIGLQLKREDQPSNAELLKKDIAMMEEELRAKNELIKKQENLIQGWRKEVQDQLEKHKIELERV